MIAGTRLMRQIGTIDSRSALLAEVDFKWLMAGQGWLVDTARLHTDPAYAARFLGSALASHCEALRQCAQKLTSGLLESDPQQDIVTVM